MLSYFITGVDTMFNSSPSEGARRAGRSISFTGLKRTRKFIFGIQKRGNDTLGKNTTPYRFGVFLGHRTGKRSLQARENMIPRVPELRSSGKCRDCYKLRLRKKPRDSSAVALFDF